MVIAAVRGGFQTERVEPFGPEKIHTVDEEMLQNNPVFQKVILLMREGGRRVSLKKKPLGTDYG